MIMACGNIILAFGALNSAQPAVSAFNTGMSGVITFGGSGGVGGGSTNLFARYFLF